MSLTSYIGSNVSIEEKGYEKEPVEGEIFVGPSFSDEGSLGEVKEGQFSTTYVFEVTFNSWGMELSPYQDEILYEENKTGLHQVCEMMDFYLDVGEFFEFYTCWVGDEFNSKEAEITLPIRDWYTEGMELREQTLIRFVKNES